MSDIGASFIVCAHARIVPWTIDVFGDVITAKAVEVAIEWSRGEPLVWEHVGTLYSRPCECEEECGCDRGNKKE